MLPRHFWHEMTTVDFAEGDTASWIAILPVAAIEQHGPHLPVATDTAIAKRPDRPGARIAARGGAGDLPAGTGGGQVQRTHIVPRHADRGLGDPDEILARYWRKRSSGRGAQARHRELARRERAAHRYRGARVARAPRHARRRDRVVPFRPAGGRVSARGVHIWHPWRRRGNVDHDAPSPGPDPARRS